MGSYAVMVPIITQAITRTEVAVSIFHDITTSRYRLKIFSTVLYYLPSYRTVHWWIDSLLVPSDSPVVYLLTTTRPSIMRTCHLAVVIVHTNYIFSCELVVVALTKWVWHSVYECTCNGETRVQQYMSCYILVTNFTHWCHPQMEVKRKYTFGPNIYISQAAQQGLVVLMASAVVVQKHETSTLRQSHNFISIDLTFGVGDYVREATSPAKFGSDPMSSRDAT